MQKKTPISEKNLSLFCLQISKMSAAGMPLNDALCVIADSKDTYGEMAAGAEAVLSNYNISGNFKESIEKTGMFPQYFADMAGIGEQTGKLDECMDKVAMYYDRDNNFKSVLKNTVIKPFVVMCIILAISAAIALKIFPTFLHVAELMDVPSGSGTWTLLRCGNILCNVCAYLMIMATALIFLLFLCNITGIGKPLINKIIQKCRMVNEIYTYTDAGKWAEIVSIMASSGITYTECARTAANAIHGSSIDPNCSECLKMLEDGHDIKDAILSAGIFDALYSSMIEAGYKVGNLDNAIMYVSESCIDTAHAKIHRLASSIEYCSFGFMSIIAGIIIVSAVFPLAGIFMGQ